MKTIAMFQPYVADTADERLQQVLRGRWVGQGALVDEFERRCADAIGLPHAIAVNSSSSAIRLALTICGVGPRDEVITTPLTCTLTNHPILEQFAVPVFADIQESSGNLDPADIAHRITPRTKAILCTHWGGQAPDLDEINAIADAHGIPVIEDASEAFGGRYKDRAVGVVSRFAAFSFQAIQIINTAEGGMLAVRETEAQRRARVLRWYAIDRETRVPNDIGYYDFDITSVGFGYHMTNVNAAIGLANLPSLPAQLAHRRGIARRYRDAFAECAGVRLLADHPDREPTYHFFTMLVDRRADFCRMMKSRGIETSIVHYRNDAYSVFGGHRDDLPSLDAFSESYIGLPTHMHLTDDDVSAVIAAVRSGW
jgi:perosamine synthetase